MGLGDRRKRKRKCTKKEPENLNQACCDKKDTKSEHSSGPRSPAEIEHSPGSKTPERDEIHGNGSRSGEKPVVEKATQLSPPERVNMGFATSHRKNVLDFLPCFLFHALPCITTTN